MAFDGHINLGKSAVATAPSPAASGTSLVLTAGHGATRVPSTLPANALVWPAGVEPDKGNSEIVRVTARSADTLTIVRAQEGSSARTILVTDQVLFGWSAKNVTDIERRLTEVHVMDSIVGDGTTDDRAALNSLLGGLAAGSVVYFPPNRTVRISAGLTSTVADVTLVGNGCLLKLDAGAAAGTVILQVTGAGTVVERFRMDSQGVADCTHVRPGADRVTVCDNTFVTPKTGGVYVVGGQVGLQVIGNRFIGAGYGVLFNDNATTSDVVISGNLFDGQGGDGDAVEVNTPTGGAKNITISNNVIRNYWPGAWSSGIGIGIAQATDVTITGNTIDHCYNDAIHVEDTSSRITITGNTIRDCGRVGITVLPGPDTPPSAITITGNTVHGCSSVDGPGGIAVEDATSSARDVVIANNVVVGCGNTVAAFVHGIVVSSVAGAVTNAIIHGNVVKNTWSPNYAAGIGVGNGKNVMVSGNVCTDDQATKTQQYGLDVYDAVVGVKQFANILAGNSLGATDYTGITSGTVGTDTASITA